MFANTPKTSGLKTRLLFSTIVLLLGFWVPAVAVGQTSEERDTETNAPAAKSPRRANSPDLSQVAKLIVQKTNQFRQAQGRPKVEVDPKLTAAADSFARYLAKTNRFGHTADGHQPAERAKQHGYQYCIVSENIAYEYSSEGFGTEALADRFVQGWEHSPGHRKNMLDPDVTDTGVAVAQSEENGYYYAVQMFGRPESKRIQFQVANQSDAAVQYEIGGRTYSLPPLATRTHQRCRPADLTFQWPAGTQSQSKTVRPSDGDKLIISREGSGEFKVKRGE